MVELQRRRHRPRWDRPRGLRRQRWPQHPPPVPTTQGQNPSSPPTSYPPQLGPKPKSCAQCPPHVPKIHGQTQGLVPSSHPQNREQIPAPKPTQLGTNPGLSANAMCPSWGQTSVPPPSPVSCCPCSGRAGSLCSCGAARGGALLVSGVCCDLGGTTPPSLCSPHCTCHRTMGHEAVPAPPGKFWGYLYPTKEEQEGGFWG